MRFLPAWQWGIHHGGAHPRGSDPILEIPDLLLYWPMDEAPGATVFREVMTGRDLEIYNPDGTIRPGMGAMPDGSLLAGFDYTLFPFGSYDVAWRAGLPAYGVGRTWLWVGNAADNGYIYNVRRPFCCYQPFVASGDSARLVISGPSACYNEIYFGTAAVKSHGPSAPFPGVDGTLALFGMTTDMAVGTFANGTQTYTGSGSPVDPGTGLYITVGSEPSTISSSGRPVPNSYAQYAGYMGRLALVNRAMAQSELTALQNALGL